jgi:ribose 5-phosphate isomerase A
VDVAELKRQAAEHAAEFVQPGMVVGLGHGSTAMLAVRRIAALLRADKLRDIVGVPCSAHVEEHAHKLGIPLTTLEQRPVVDLTIDGADEVAPTLDLIKGRGGALLREKIVAQATTREIIVVDESKLSPALGTRMPVPVEVLPFGWRSQLAYLESLGARPAVRENPDGSSFITDQGNYILDCVFGAISQPAQLAAQLEARAGIMGHGLFVGQALEVVIAGGRGIRHLKRDARGLLHGWEGE